MGSAIAYLGVTAVWAWLCFVWGRECGKRRMARGIVLPGVIGLLIAIMPPQTFSSSEDADLYSSVSSSDSVSPSEGRLVRVLRLAGVAVLAAWIGTGARRVDAD